MGNTASYAWRSFCHLKHYYFFAIRRLNYHLIFPPTISF